MVDISTIETFKGKKPTASFLKSLNTFIQNHNPDASNPISIDSINRAYSILEVAMNDEQKPMQERATAALALDNFAETVFAINTTVQDQGLLHEKNTQKKLDLYEGLKGRDLTPLTYIYKAADLASAIPGFLKEKRIANYKHERAREFLADYNKSCLQEVQAYLVLFTKEDKRINPVYVDGLDGRLTRNATKTYARWMGLEDASQETMHNHVKSIFRDRKETFATRVIDSAIEALKTGDNPQKIKAAKAILNVIRGDGAPKIKVNTDLNNAENLINELQQYQLGASMQVTVKAKDSDGIKAGEINPGTAFADAHSGAKTNTPQETPEVNVVVPPINPLTPV